MAVNPLLEDSLVEEAKRGRKDLTTPFHNDGDISDAEDTLLASLLVGQMRPAFFLLAPGDPGASTSEYVTVIAKRST